MADFSTFKTINKLRRMAGPDHGPVIRVNHAGILLKGKKGPETLRSLVASEGLECRNSGHFRN